jgi:formate dehydrogenase subunit beta
MPKIAVKDRDPVRSLQTFLKSLIELGELSALLVPMRLPDGRTLMPSLITDPERMADVDPLAPAFPINAAKVVSRLTRKPVGERIGVVLRPCEIRAFVELVKLKQGSVDELVLIGVDCLGAYSNARYHAFTEKSGPESTLAFLKEALQGSRAEDPDLSTACKSCEHPVPEGCDLTVGLLGMDVETNLLVKANTAKGESIAKKIGLAPDQEPPARKTAIADLVVTRRNYRDRMFEQTSEATSDMAKLVQYFSKCVNCYNCRVACPVCYCKECVFVTDVFDHEPSQYLRWARRKGVIKMPTDTIFYHLTRLAHMSTACVGCGQCSNACPNDIPVMELFRMVAEHTQKAFGYEAGRSLNEPPPLSVFKEKEFSEVTGGRD